MFKVLQDWQEIGEAVLGFQRLGIPLHGTAQKNWDHWLLYNALADASRDSRIADLGCGEGHTLRMLHAVGYRALDGVDFKISPTLRARQALAMYRERTLQPPYRLFTGDLHQTSLEAGAFDTVVSVSTIEHGVDLARFFVEAARLLRPGGRLFVTTDYWEEKIDTSDAAQAFGLPWKIFSRDEIVELANAAATAGLHPVTDGGIPACADKPIYWNKRPYTFIAMLFRKTDGAPTD